MLQTFLIVLILIIGMFIGGTNNLNQIYLETLFNSKKIDFFDYNYLMNLNEFKLEYCEKEKEGGGSNLEGYCLKDENLFIPNGNNKNLFVKVILKEENGKKYHQYINDGFIYIPNKNIIGKIYINEISYKPNNIGLSNGETLSIEINDLNGITNFEEIQSQSILLTDVSTEEKIINSILQHFCSNDIFCNGASNFPGSIFNNYVYNISDDKKRLEINLKTNNHQIKTININVLSGINTQDNLKKWQIEPLNETFRGF